MNTQEWFVRSSDGTDYRVGAWVDGQWVTGDRAQASREHALLAEPGSWVWARSQRTRPSRSKPYLLTEKQNEVVRRYFAGEATIDELTPIIAAQVQRLVEDGHG